MVFLVAVLSFDLIVSAVTASTTEWKKDDIQVFNLLDEVEKEDKHIPEFDTTLAAEYTKNADEIV